MYHHRCCCRIFCWSLCLFWVGTHGGRVLCYVASFRRVRERDLGAVVAALLPLFLFLLLFVIVIVLAAAVEGVGPEVW